MINRPVVTQILQHDLSLQHQDTELLKEVEVAMGSGRLIDLDTGEISDFTQVCKRVSPPHTTIATTAAATTATIAPFTEKSGSCPLDKRR